MATPLPENTTRAPSTLVDSGETEVQFLTGKTATANYRRLTLEELYLFAEHVRYNRTPRMVALCFDQTIEWVNSLSDKCFLRLVKECLAPNFRRLLDLLEDPVMAMLLGPVYAQGLGTVQELVKILAPSTPGLSTSASSPAPAPTASVEGTGTASSN